MIEELKGLKVQDKETGEVYNVIMLHVMNNIEVWVDKKNAWWESIDKYNISRYRWGIKYS